MSWPSDGNKGSYSGNCRNHIYPFMTFFEYQSFLTFVEYLSFLDCLWKCVFLLSFQLLLLSQSHICRLGCICSERFLLWKHLALGSVMGFWRQILVLWDAPDWKAKPREPFWVRSRDLVPAIFNTKCFRNTLLEYEKYSFENEKNIFTGKFGGAPDWKANSTVLSPI